jgi:hypothetical protein
MSEAERLACELDAVPENGADPQLIEEAAAELRRLEAECGQLRNALKQLVTATKHLGPCPGTLDIAERLLKETK